MTGSISRCCKACILAHSCLHADNPPVFPQVFEATVYGNERAPSLAAAKVPYTVTWDTSKPFAEWLLTVPEFRILQLAQQSEGVVRLLGA